MQLQSAAERTRPPASLVLQVLPGRAPGQVGDIDPAAHMHHLLVCSRGREGQQMPRALGPKGRRHGGRQRACGTPGARGTAGLTLPLASGAGLGAQGGRAGPRQQPRGAWCPIRLGQGRGCPAAAGTRPSRNLAPHAPQSASPAMFPPPTPRTASRPADPALSTEREARRVPRRPLCPARPQHDLLSMGLSALWRASRQLIIGSDRCVRLPTAPERPGAALAEARCQRLASRPIPRLAVLDP